MAGKDKRRDEYIERLKKENARLKKWGEDNAALAADRGRRLTELENEAMELIDHLNFYARTAEERGEAGSSEVVKARQSAIGWMNMVSSNIREIRRLKEDAKAMKFIHHVQEHLDKGEDVVCKICGKTAEEIIMEGGDNEIKV